MTTFVGRSGADAVFKALHRICIVLTHYSVKLDVAIGLAESASLITSTQATVARTFLATSSAVCDIFKIVADNSGF